MSNRKCYVETNTIEDQWVCRNKGFPTPVTCLKVFPGYMGQAPPTWVKGEVISIFPPRPDISITLGDWSRNLVFQPINIVANLTSDHMRSELGLKCISTSPCRI